MPQFKLFKQIDANKIISMVDETNTEQFISIQTAEKKFNIRWLEYGDSKNDIYQKLQVRYMGVELGWGLFARKDFQADETIGILTGEIYFQNRDKKITSTHILLSDAPNNQFQVVDADKAGNLTRFIQHLPTEEIVSKIEFQQVSLKQEVATCNVKHSLIELENGIVTECYKAARFIKAGEIFGSNYDSSAWLNKQPLLLRRDGSIIKQKLYSYPSISVTQFSF